MASNYNRKSNSSVSRRSSRGSQAGKAPSRGSSRPAPRASRGGQYGQAPSTRQRPATGRPGQNRAYGSQPAPRLTSVRVGDLNQNDAGRAHRVQRSYRRHIGRIVAVIAVVAVLAVGGIVLYNADVFPVNKVTVTGVEHLTADEMTELASVPQGTTLLRVDTGAIRNSLLQEPWVKDASVNRVFPDTLELAITERSIAAVVDVPVNNAQTVEEWAISSDGIWLMHIPSLDSEKAKSTSSKVYEDAAQALHITGVPYGIAPKVGSVCTDDNVNNALAIVSGMTTELAGQVKTVSATGTETTTLILKNGIEIAFGSAKDIRDKERVCLKLIADNPGKIAYINVRVVDKPTWRSAD